MNYQRNSRSCDCASCREKRDRDFCRILFESYATAELDTLYPENGLHMKNLLWETAQGTRHFELAVVPADGSGFEAR